MQNASLDLSLEIGGADQTINVSADVPLVNASDSTIGRTVSNVEIDNLPLVNRNVDRLLQLVPGVQKVDTINNLGYQEIKVLVNGSTDGFVGQVSYYLDGGLNMTGLRNSGNQVPNPDAISQFNVVTNNYSAQIRPLLLCCGQCRLQERHEQHSTAPRSSSSATETSTRSPITPG